MATNRYDTTALLEQVNRLPMVPTSQALFSDTDILQFANQELKNLVTPTLQSVVEEYFVYVEDYVVGPDAGTITIPPEASGLRLREVYWLTELAGQIKMTAYRLQPEQLGSGVYGINWVNPASAPWGNPYYLQNNEIIFYPRLANTGYVRVAYMRIPNELVLPSAGVTVGSVQSPNTFTSVGTPPSVWETDLGSNYQFDVISPSLPFNTKKRVTVNGISGNTFYVNDPDEWAEIAVGDYFYYAGEAPVIQYVPQEAFYVLAQATAVKLLEALGDTTGLQVAKAALRDSVLGMLKIVSPRSLGQPKRIRNRQSVMGAVRGGGGWWWWN